MRLKIGARASDLARIQAYAVGDLLTAEGHCVEYIFRESLGDLRPDIDLSKTFEKGVFTQDFYEGLQSGQYDLVVHSWKDLPTENRKATQIAATLPREDMRDLLLFKKKRRQNPSKSVHIFSSSPRRAYNLSGFLKDVLPGGYESVEFENIRGNIPTRLRKLMQSESGDGLIVAKAALDRLLAYQTSPSSDSDSMQEMQEQLRSALAQLDWMVLPLSVNPCAAAQGALAIEIALNRPEILEAVKALNCADTWECVTEEREVLSGFGGGCHQKIGISLFNRPYGKIKSLRGLTDSGIVLEQFEIASRPKAFPVSPQPEEIFPSPGDRVLVKRERLAVAAETLKSRDLWLAKAFALPESYEPEAGQLIWTAGVSSWKQLAKRGVWVHGCSEGLGEQEPERLETLLNRNPNWLKLSHEQGTPATDKDFLASYRLHLKEELVPLHNKKYFYWQSGSQFLQAWERFSDVLKKAHHSCGPGHTYSILKTRIGKPEQLAVFLSLQDWWKALGVPQTERRE